MVTMELAKVDEGRLVDDGVLELDVEAAEVAQRLVGMLLVLLNVVEVVGSAGNE